MKSLKFIDDGNCKAFCCRRGSKASVMLSLALNDSYLIRFSNFPNIYALIRIDNGLNSVFTHRSHAPTIVKYQTSTNKLYLPSSNAIFYYIFLCLFTFLFLLRRREPRKTAVLSHVCALNDASYSQRNKSYENGINQVLKFENENAIKYICAAMIFYLKSDLWSEYVFVKACVPKNIIWFSCGTAFCKLSFTAVRVCIASNQWHVFYSIKFDNKKKSSKSLKDCHDAYVLIVVNSRACGALNGYCPFVAVYFHSNQSLFYRLFLCNRREKHTLW